MAENYPWQQFSEGSPNYLGGQQGPGLPSWMQQNYGSTIGGQNGSSGQTPPQNGWGGPSSFGNPNAAMQRFWSGAPGSSGSTAPINRWQDQIQSGLAPQWFSDWQARQAAQSGSTAAPLGTTGTAATGAQPQQSAQPPQNNPMAAPMAASITPTITPSPMMAAAQAQQSGAGAAPAAAPPVTPSYAAPSPASAPAYSSPAAPIRNTADYSDYSPPATAPAPPPAAASAPTPNYTLDNSGNPVWSGAGPTPPAKWMMGPGGSSVPTSGGNYTLSDSGEPIWTGGGAAPAPKFMMGPGGDSIPTGANNYGTSPAANPSTDGGAGATTPPASATPDYTSMINNLTQQFGSGQGFQFSRGGRVQRFSEGGPVRHMADGGGLASAAQQLQSYGRGSDTMLAHVSPDEASFIDRLQGGRQTNPMTGLPEYGMFGNILKAVARAAGAIGGFMIGGPAGAAVGAGAATKLTGGSWKEALGSAALSGVGSFATQGLTGGGWHMTGGALGGGSAAGAANPAAMTEAAGDPVGSLIGQSAALPAAAANAAAPGLGAQFLQTASSYPGIAAGIGANMGTPQQPSIPALPSVPQSKINLNVVPQPRTFMPFPGDQLHAAEPGGGLQGYEFYSPLNPQPQYLRAGGQVRGYAPGGPVVTGPMGPTLGMRGLRGGGDSPPSMPGQVVNSVPAGGIGGIGSHEGFIRKAAMLGYMNARKGGKINGAPMVTGRAAPSPAAQAGAISGPGDGTSDSVPAMLSDGEHVIDASTTSLAGNGSNNAGHHVLENIKQEIRSQAGQKNPRTPPSPVGLMVARAKRRAGVK